MSSDDNDNNESIESNPEETTKISLESSSKSNENNKTQIKTEKQNSIIPNDRTTGTYKKGKKKHFNVPEEKVEGDSTKSKDNTVEFSYEKFPKKSNKESLDRIKPHKSHQKRRIESHHSKSHKSTDLQEAPSLKYKKITYLSVIEGKSFHKRYPNIFSKSKNGVLI